MPCWFRRASKTSYGNVCSEVNSKLHSKTLDNFTNGSGNLQPFSTGAVKPSMGQKCQPLFFLPCLTDSADAMRGRYHTTTTC